MTPVLAVGRSDGPDRPGFSAGYEIDDQKAKMNASLSYRFGFLLAREGEVPPENIISGWRHLSLAGFVLQTHPETTVRILSCDRTSVVVVGDVFAVGDDDNIDAILKQLCIDGNWQHLDGLAGRFALLTLTDGECRVVHDPFGSRSVYYRRDDRFGISSHAGLLAAAFGDTVDEDAQRFVRAPEYKARGTSYLPGDATMFGAIRALIPNNGYDSRTGRTFRYWPRNPVTPGTMEQFLAGCDTYFSKFAAHLRGLYTPLLGVTGGVDTRAVIAGLLGRDLPMRTVTWTGGRLPEEEVDIVARMVRHLARPHVYMKPGAVQGDRRFEAVLQATDAATGFCGRGNSKLSANMAMISAPGDVFVRGYGGEIIRGFYNRHGHAVGDDVAKGFFRLYATRRVPNPSAEFTKFSMRAIEGFMERANYDGDLFNLDLRDLYYWEQRMGVWGANMHNEMDPAVYSITGLNSRTLYEAAFGLPDSVRLGSEIMLHITRRYDARLAEIGRHS